MKALLVAVGLLLATQASAQDKPRFCPNRPDLGAGPCTTEPGRVLVEMSAFDLEHDRGGGETHDVLLVGDVLVRTGLGNSTELQLGWTPIGLTYDRTPTGRDRTTGIGDLRVAVRQNLINPTGDGFGIAVEPFVTLPIGRQPIGRDGASFGVQVPVAIPLTGKWDLAFTGQASAEQDSDGRGRHAALLGIIGLGYAISDAVGVVGEISVERDEDPSVATTETLAAGSIAWQPRDGLQLDLLVAAGLNRTSADVRVALGGAILF